MSKGGVWDREKPGIRAGGNVEGLAGLDGTMLGLGTPDARLRHGARARDRAEVPITGSAVKRAAGGVIPVYRRSTGTASCMMGVFVAENGVKRPICHIGASDSIPGLVPRLPDRLSYESGQSAGGRIMGEWTAAATKVDKAPVRAGYALRTGFEVAIPAARSPRSAYAGGQSEAPTRDAAGLTRQITIA